MRKFLSENQKLAYVIKFLKQDCRINFQSLEFKANPKMYSQFSAVIFNDTNGDIYINATTMQSVEYLKGIMSFTVVGRADAKNTSSERLLFKGTINSCNLSKGIFGNIVSKIVNDLFQRCSNIRIACPQPKGFYYLSNCRLDVERFIPPVLWVTFNRYWEFDATMKVKLHRNKPMEHFFSTKIKGDVDV